LPFPTTCIRHPIVAAQARPENRYAGGAEIFSRGDLTAAAAGSRVVITLDVPASAFESGDYMLTVQGATTSGDFEDVSRSLIRADKR